MRALIKQAGRTGVWCALMLSACARLHPAGSGGVIAPDADADRKARALTHASQALTDEREGRPEAAVSNLTVAVGLDPGNEELRYRAALALMQQKRIPEAQRLLRDGVSRNPTSEKALLWLALSYRAADENEQAIAVYRKAMKVAPESPVAYLECAALLARAGSLKEGIDVIDGGLGHVRKPIELLAAMTELLVKRAGAEPADDSLKQQCTRALSLVERERGKNPDDQNLMFLLSDLHILAGEPEKALALLEELERKNPSDPIISQKLAGLFSGMGDKTRALEIVQKLSDKDPGNGRMHYYRGELLEQLGNDDKAREAFEAAAAAKRPDATGFLKLAVLEVDENPEGAMATLRKGLTKFPRDPRIGEMLGYILLSENRAEEAVGVFEDATRIRSRLRDAGMPPALRLSHILALQMAHRLPDAGKLLRKAVEEEPSFLPGYAQLVLRSGSSTGALDAVSVIEQVREGDRQNPAPLIFQGLLYSAADRFTNALSAFAEAEKIAGSSSRTGELFDAQFHFWYASAAERAGHIDEAANRFLRCLELEPEYGEAMNYLAYMWAEKGLHLDDALKWSQRSLELEPDSPAFLDTLGWIYFMKGETDQALKEIQKAANLMPEDPTIVEHLGDIMAKLGKMDRALDYWKRSFVLDADNERVQKHLEAAQVDLAPLRKQAEARQEAATKASRLKRLSDDPSPAAVP